MKSAGYYVIAALLVLASLPIYWAILHAGDRPVSGVPAHVGLASAARESSSTVSHKVLTADEAAAMAGLTSGRAKCIRGVVYRTYDHVIEPWPGGVRCLAAPGVTEGRTVGVVMTGTP